MDDKMIIDEKFLADFIRIAGTALEQEDRYIAGCIMNNPNVFKNKGSTIGILQLNNEAYYQFVIARNSMSTFPCFVKTEKYTTNGRFDIAFLSTNEQDSEIVAYCEIKRWMSGNEKKEIPSICKDVDKLKQTKKPGIMLLISVNPSSDTDSNIIILEGLIPDLQNYQKAIYRFTTIGHDGKEKEFFILGYLITPL